jgi:DNA replication and repair protein RecF
MRVDWLSLASFRSYSSLHWEPDPGVNLLVGSNGAGKTNVLEAVAYLSSLKSFRSAPDASLVGDEANSAVIRSQVTSAERSRLIEMEIRGQGPRVVQVDKNRLRRAADLLGVIRVVSFLPDDIDLVKRGPALRRDLLDDLAVQLWPGSHMEHSEFERALRQRNAFLKSGQRDAATLDVWDARVALTGGKVLARRARLLEILRPLLDQAYAAIAGPSRPVGISYTTSWDGTELMLASAADYTSNIAEGLERNRRGDYERRMTSVGPHRDEPGFLISGAPARTQASQGEQRTMALGVKLAAHHAILDVIDEPPVLLLDDVFSELDQERAVALAGSLPEDTQTLITSARLEDIPIRGRTWTVGEGKVA